MSRIKLQVISTREAMDLLTKVMLLGMHLIGGGNVRSRSVSTAGASDILLLSAVVIQCFAGSAVFQSESLRDFHPDRS